MDIDNSKKIISCLISNKEKHQILNREFLQINSLLYYLYAVIPWKLNIMYLKQI